jgi:hypothetical protein
MVLQIYWRKERTMTNRFQQDIGYKIRTPPKRNRIQRDNYHRIGNSRTMSMFQLGTYYTTLLPKKNTYRQDNYYKTMIPLMKNTSQLSSSSTRQPR